MSRYSFFSCRNWVRKKQLIKHPRKADAEAGVLLSNAIDVLFYTQHYFKTLYF
jgi:hypothetical protein